MYGKTPYMGRQLGIQIKQAKKKASMHEMHTSLFKNI
jgi:hypothetical protein